MRVFATCDIGPEALERIRQAGIELEVYDQIEAPPKSLILEKLSSGIDGLITTLRDEIDEEIFVAGRGHLKIVAQDAVGFDNIDREAANRHRIPFTNTADVLTNATAEFAFFILGAVSRRLHSSEMLVRDHQWDTWHPFEPFLGAEVTGKTVAIIGTGRIGRALALKCSGFEMDLLLVDAYPNQQFLDSLKELGLTRSRLGLGSRESSVDYVSFDEALARADYVSLHVPLTDETRHLMNTESLHEMKPTAFLINTSRGAVVDESALATALQQGWIAGAALDVFEKEPLPADSPLRAPELEGKMRVFHHFASATRETRLSPDPAVGMAGRCVQGLLDVLQGNYDGEPARMPYVVNKEAFGS